MGGSESIVYSVELPGQEQPANSTKVRRHPRYLKGLHNGPAPDMLTMRDIVLRTFERYPQNKCFGTIKSVPTMHEGKEKITKALETVTYQEVQKKVQTLANGIAKLGFAAEIEEVPGIKLKMLGIFSKNRVEWMFLDLVCILYGYTLIPIYDTLGPENITYVFNHSNVTNMFCSKQSAEILMKTKDIGKLRTLVYFDDLTPEIIENFKARGVECISFAEVLKIGSSAPKVEYNKPTPKDCFTFSYTSGTTGPPKAAMLSQGNLASFCSIMTTNPDFNMGPNESYLSYLPLPHVLERICVHAFLYLGSMTSFYSGDVQKIKDDIEVVKPTFFCSVPRLYTRLHDGVNAKFKQAEGVKKVLIDRALEVKLENAQEYGNYTHQIYDRLVFNKTREALGGNMKIMISGSAPLLPKVHAFMKVIACAPLIEGYGQTESTGASFVTSGNDPACGHVGGPTSNTYYKLVDIPEMHYTHLDVDEKGRPCPRGEICIRGPCVFLGYYKDEYKTREAIDKDGWLHTGDVGAILPDTFALKIIDRKKNIFKLQQGEYVASEKVEAVYLKRPEVAEIFLHGDSNETFCVAVIVPYKKAIEEIAQKVGATGSTYEIYANQKVRTELLNVLNAFSKKEGLQSFEQPKNVYIETEPFLSRGIVTNTMKVQRHEAKKFYKKQIDEMYKEGMLGGGEKK